MDFSISNRATLAPEPLRTTRYAIPQGKPARLSTLPFFLLPFSLKSTSTSTSTSILSLNHFTLSTFSFNLDSLFPLTLISTSTSTSTLTLIHFTLSTFSFTLSTFSFTLDSLFPLTFLASPDEAYGVGGASRAPNS